MAAWWWVAILGYIISLATMSTGGRYFSLFLMTSGYAGAHKVEYVSFEVPNMSHRLCADLKLGFECDSTSTCEEIGGDGSG